jgi:PAS domain S-box-containing protein
VTRSHGIQTMIAGSLVVLAVAFIVIAARMIQRVNDRLEHISHLGEMLRLVETQRNAVDAIESSLFRAIATGATPEQETLGNASAAFTDAADHLASLVTRNQDEGTAALIDDSREMFALAMRDLALWSTTDEAALGRVGESLTASRAQTMAAATSIRENRSVVSAALRGDWAAVGTMLFIACGTVVALCLLGVRWMTLASRLDRAREESRQAELNLRRSQSRLDAAVLLTGMYVWDWDVRTGRVERTHPPESLGYGPDEIEPTINAWKALIHPDDVASMRGAFEPPHPDSPTQADEYRMRSKSGEWRRILDRGAVIERDEHGRAARVVGTCVDVTDLHATRAALAESEAWYRRLVEGANVVAWEYDLGARCFTRISPQAERLLGCPESAWMEPMFWTSRLHPEDAAEVRDRIRQHLRAGEDYEIEYRLVHRDGSTVWVRELTTVLPPRERPGHLVGLFVNVTALREAERAARETEERYRRIVETAEEGICVTDAANHITFVNSKMAQILGADPSSLPGRSVFDFFDPAFLPELRDHLERRRHGERETYEARMRRANGSMIWVLIAATPIRDARGAFQGTLGMVADITGRKRSELLADSQRDILELVASRTSLEPVLDRLCLAIESLIPGSCCTVMLLRDGVLHLAAAPSVPASKRPLIDRIPSGAGSCGVAAQTGRRTIVADTSIEPAWAGLREVVAELGIRACWSIPICSEPDQVAGTFAISMCQPTSPDEDDLQVLETAARLGGIALDRFNRLQQLRESEDRLRTMAENVPGAVFDYDYIPGQPRQLRFLGPGLADIIGAEGARAVANCYDCIFERLHPDDNTVRQAAVETAIAADGRLDLEMRLRHDDGQWVWTRSLSRGTPLPGGGTRWQGVIINISDRKQAEEALRDSERRFRTLFESASVGIAQVGVDRRFLEVNQALCDMLGYTRDELLTKTFDDVTHPEDVRSNLTLFSRGMAGELAQYEMEKRYLHRDGSVVWAHLSTSILRNARGEPLHVISVVSDVTAARAAERALRERDRMIATLMSNLPGMAYRCRNDRGWTMEFASDGCLELTGYPATDLMSGRVTLGGDVIVPEDRAMGWDLVQAAVVEHQPWQIVYRIRRADGQMRWVWEQGIGVREESGAVAALEGFITDITERVHAEERARDREARLDLLFSQTPAILWTTDASLVFTSSAGAALSAIGLKPGEVVGRPLAEFFGAGQDSFEPIRRHRLALAGESSEFDIEWSGRAFRTRVEPLRNARGTIIGVIGLASDTTERRRSEDELRRRSEHERLLLSELDHRVRNNLSALMSLVELGSRSSVHVAGFAESMRGRLRAMAAAHRMIARAAGASVDLRSLIESLLSPDQRAQVSLDVPPASLSAQQTNAVAIVIQELITNSTKHGALRAPDGAVAVVGTECESAPGVIELRWVETSHAVAPPRAPGLGTALIEGLVRSDLQGDVSLTYTGTGANHMIRFPLGAATLAPAAHVA